MFKKPGKPDTCREILSDLVEWAARTGGWEAPVWTRAKAYLRAHPIVAKDAPGYYLIEVMGGAEPFIRGPYKTKASRATTARQIKADNTLLWLDITPRGGVECGAFPPDFFATGDSAGVRSMSEFKNNLGLKPATKTKSS